MCLGPPAHTWIVHPPHPPASTASWPAAGVTAVVTVAVAVAVGVWCCAPLRQPATLNNNTLAHTKKTHNNPHTRSNPWCACARAFYAADTSPFEPGRLPPDPATPRPPCAISYKLFVHYGDIRFGVRARPPRAEGGWLAAGACYCASQRERKARAHTLRRTSLAALRACTCVRVSRIM